MPTLPPHQAREFAESFGTDAERYDRARPRYPSALIERIASGGPAVLDVGIGTGIAARQLRDAGCQVLGVEVDPRMAAVARAYGLDVEVAKFEDWDPGDRRYDTIASGQTWHWIDPQRGTAKAAEALRAGGRLAVFWNVAQPPPDMAAAFAAIYDRVLPGLPFNPFTVPALTAYAGLSARALDGIGACDSFGAPDQWRYAWQQAYTRDEWLDQMPTSGMAGQLPPGKLD